MAEGSTDPGGRVGETPEAIRAAMARTRAGLTDTLAALKSRAIGPRRPADTKRSKIVATQKTKTKTAKKVPTATKTAKRAVADTKAGAKKAVARGTKQVKSTTSRIVKEAKEVLGDVLVGAASGAVKGAAEAVVVHAGDAALMAERAKPAKSRSSNASSKKK